MHASILGKAGSFVTLFVFFWSEYRLDFHPQRRILLKRL